MTWQTSRVLPSWSPGRLKPSWSPGRLKAKLQTDQGSGHSPELVDGDGRCWSMCHGHGNHMWSLAIVIQPGEPPKTQSHLRPHAEIGNDKEDQDTSPKALAPHRKKLRHTRCSSPCREKKNIETVAKLHFNISTFLELPHGTNHSWQLINASCNLPRICAGYHWNFVSDNGQIWAK
jgi:hypothetical protein